MASRTSLRSYSTDVGSDDDAVSSGGVDDSLERRRRRDGDDLVWRELEELRARVRSLEIKDRGAPSVAGSSASGASGASSSSVQPLLAAALEQARPLVADGVYGPLAAAAADAEALAATAGDRARADDLLRSLTELCMALAHDEPDAPRKRPATARPRPRDVVRAATRTPSSSSSTSLSSAHTPRAVADEFPVRTARHSMPSLAALQARRQPPPEDDDDDESALERRADKFGHLFSRRSISRSILESDLDAPRPSRLGFLSSPPLVRDR
ncbi:uncharacterized protein V1510DRAFT_449768 [Dipodascopsis tothii]|uniref:uncharacterized protein n=1 Tax=Dipodascopsis tothii TaxID=44089 RepID=UPI0034CEE124